MYARAHIGVLGVGDDEIRTLIGATANARELAVESDHERLSSFAAGFTGRSSRMATGLRGRWRSSGLAASLRPPAGACFCGWSVDGQKFTQPAQRPGRPELAPDRVNIAMGNLIDFVSTLRKPGPEAQIRRPRSMRPYVPTEEPKRCLSRNVFAFSSSAQAECSGGQSWPSFLRAMTSCPLDRSRATFASTSPIPRASSRA